jgi:tetratricopeptide (TPR) repeat protein
MFFLLKLRGDMWNYHRMIWIRNMLALTILVAAFTYGANAQGKGRLVRITDEARSAFEVRNYEKALSVAKRGLQEDTYNLDMLLLVAEVYHETGHPEEEIEYLERARNVAGSPVLIDFRLGSSYLKTGQYENAYLLLKDI